MSWPQPSDLRATLASPQTAFRDPRLQVCAMETTETGEPRAWSGSLADVYKAIAPDGKHWALRTFKTEVSGRRERYEWIAKYLADARLSCLVDFEYHDSGIHLPGDDVWYPLMVMDWVEGATLLQYVRTRCLARKAASMAKAAQHWAALVAELAEAQVVHGDLEPANVLVTRTGRLRLVDYDCMCVPALIGLRSPERGLEPYQHPRRRTNTPLSSDLDNFAALVIYTGLRALAAAPGLWEKHVEPSGRNTLLFRDEDFRDPDASPLFHDLKVSPDREVRRLAKLVFKAADAKLHQTPSLGQVLKEISGWPGADTARSVEQAPPNTALPRRVPSDATRPRQAPRAAIIAEDRDLVVPAGNPGSKVILQVVSGPIEGQEFVFDRRETFLFGRGEDCHARIKGDREVSRHHFLLEIVPPHVRIQDLGSRNGTFVNGQRHGTTPGDPATAQIQAEVDLKSGDRITVGRTVIEIRIESAPLPAAPDAATKGLRGALPPRAIEPASGLSGFEIGDSLGSGPWGTVYCATRKTDGRVVAVKIVQPMVDVNETEALQFLQRVEALRTLQHSGIAGLFEIGRTEQDFYCVTHYCSGKSLAEAMVSRGGPLTLAEARPLLLQCLAALEYAHQRGFIHCNLKPQNILMENRTGGACAMISDFGLAWQFEMAGFSGPAATGGTRVGHCFMPPEQLAGFQNCQPASDLWSLAATFYLAMTGQHPYDFHGSDPVPLSLRNPSIPSPVAAAIDRALRNDPAARYPSAGTMIGALEQAFTQAGVRLR